MKEIRGIIRQEFVLETGEQTLKIFKLNLIILFLRTRHTLCCIVLLSKLRISNTTSFVSNNFIAIEIHDNYEKIILL